MMATGTPTGPLENDGEVGVRSGDTDDLSDPFYRAGFECDVFNARSCQSFDYLCGLFCARNTSSDAETLDRQPFLPHVLPQRKLEGKLLRVDVKRVQGDTETRRYLRLDFSDLSAQGSSIIVTTTSELDVEASGEDGADETAFRVGGSTAY